MEVQEGFKDCSLFVVKEKPLLNVRYLKYI